MYRFSVLAVGLGLIALTSAGGEFPSERAQKIREELALGGEEVTQYLTPVEQSGHNQAAYPELLRPRELLNSACYNALGDFAQREYFRITTPKLFARAATQTEIRRLYASLSYPDCTIFDFRPKVVVIRHEEINAFHFTNGTVVLTTGMLKYLQYDEGLIEYVLIHELAHLLAQHRAELLATALVEGFPDNLDRDAVSAGPLPRFVALLTAGAPGGLSYRFPTFMEQEADTIASKIRVGSGTTNPVSAAKRMYDMFRKTTESDRPAWFTVHGFTEERLKNIYLIRKKQSTETHYVTGKLF